MMVLGAACWRRLPSAWVLDSRGYKFCFIGSGFWVLDPGSVYVPLAVGYLNKQYSVQLP